MFNTVHRDGKISRDCNKDVTSGKSCSSRRFLREFVAKAGPNRASIYSSEKRIMLELGYQLTVLLVKVVGLRTTFSENSKPV